jgi:hypothetical protein
MSIIKSVTSRELLDELILRYYIALGASGNDFRVVRLIRDAYRDIEGFVARHPDLLPMLPTAPPDLDDPY